MLPIRLELDGIHSFKTEQVIDFSNINGSFFGIFGATGSGKSTILDAITLALYGKVQRAKDNADFINLAKNSAFVRLSFETIYNGKQETFLIERNFKRKKETRKVDSSAVFYKKKGNSFEVETEGVFNCDAKIKSVLGLGFDEFSKCIALPQGQFADFIKSTPNERTGLISNIFDLQGYGTPIYEKAREKEQIYKEKIAEINGKLFELADISEQSLEELNARLNEYVANLNEINDSLDIATKKFDDGKQAYFKQVQLQKAKDRAEQLKLESETMAKLEERLAKIKLAMPLSKSLDEVTTLSIESKKLQADLEQCKANNATISSEYNASKQIYDKFNEKYLENYNAGLKRINKLEDLKNKENVCVKLKQDNLQFLSKTETLEKLKAEQEEIRKNIIANISFLEEDEKKVKELIKSLEVDNSIVSQVKKGVDLGSQIEIIDKIANSVNDSLESKRNELKEFEVEFENKNNEIEQLKQNYNQILNNFEDSESIREQLNSDYKNKITLSVELKSTKNVLEIINSLIVSFEKDKEKLINLSDKLKTEIEELANKLNYKQEAVEVAKKYYLELLNSREQGLVGKGAFYVYNSARPNSACPVCGNIVDGKVKINEYPREISKNQTDDAFGDFNKLNDEFNSVLALNENKKAMLDGVLERIDELNKQLEFLKKKYKALIEKYVSPYENEKIDEKIEKLDINCEDILIKLQKIEGFGKRNNELLVEKSQISGKISSLQTEILNLENQLSELYALKNERKKIINSLEKQFGGQSLVMVKNAIDNNLEKLENAKQKMSEIDKTLQENKLNLNSCDNKITEVSLEIKVNKDKIEENNITINEINNAITEQLNEKGLTLSQILENEKNQLQDYQNKYKEISQKVELLYQKKMACESELKLIASKLKEKLTQFETMNTQFNVKLKEGRFLDVETLKSYFVDENTMFEIEEKLQNYASEKGLVRAQIEHLEQELEGIVINTEEIAELELQINSNKEKVNNLQIEIGKLKGEIERITSKFAIKKDLLEMLSKLEIDLDYAKELVKLLRGKALAQFVCDEYIEEITLRANNIANLLLDGKFTLKFETSDFLVEDNLNSGEPRAVATLSGGETFLISLSLALAISETIATMSGKNMDFFFLDEGFGTLDNELCETVVSALYKLESKNLKIGVISHVELLYEKIKNKIIVSKDEEHGSQVRMEYSL